MADTYSIVVGNHTYSVIPGDGIFLILEGEVEYKYIQRDEHGIWIELNPGTQIRMEGGYNTHVNALGRQIEKHLE